MPRESYLSSLLGTDSDLSLLATAPCGKRRNKPQIRREDPRPHRCCTWTDQKRAMELTYQFLPEIRTLRYSRRTLLVEKLPVSAACTNTTNDQFEKIPSSSPLRDLSSFGGVRAGPTWRFGCWCSARRAWLMDTRGVKEEQNPIWPWTV